MDYSEALKRAVATFVAGATAAPLTTQVFDCTYFEAALMAGVIALWNLAGRTAQAFLVHLPEDRA